MPFLRSDPTKGDFCCFLEFKVCISLSLAAFSRAPFYYFSFVHYLHVQDTLPFTGVGWILLDVLGVRPRNYKTLFLGRVTD